MYHFIHKTPLGERNVTQIFVHAIPEKLYAIYMPTSLNGIDREGANQRCMKFLHLPTAKKGGLRLTKIISISVKKE
jgi:hypothetical protein